MKFDPTAPASILLQYHMQLWAFRTQYPADQAKVIMTTALNEEKNVKKAFELGCTVYCAKPIDLEKLKDMLEKLGF